LWVEFQVNAKPRVGLFVTCLVDLYRPNIGFAAIALLEGMLAKQTIDAFTEFDYVVAPSGSCAGMLKHHYPQLLNDDPEWMEKATEFADRVFELTSFLVDVMKFDLESNRFNATVTYHDSCSGLRELDIKDQPRKLLSKVEGVSVKEMEDTEVCCGFGGTFCIKFPEISERMVNDKAALAKQSGADVLTGGDLGCLLNISGRLQRLSSSMRVYHVAEILAGMSATVPAIGEPANKDDQS